MLEKDIFNIIQRKIKPAMQHMNSEFPNHLSHIAENAAAQRRFGGSVYLNEIKSACIKEMHSRADEIISIIEEIFNTTNAVLNDDIKSKSMTLANDELKAFCKRSEDITRQKIATHGSFDVSELFHNPLSDAMEMIEAELDLYDLKKRSGGDMPFDELMQDSVSLIKKNGDQYDNIRASVQRDRIFTNDTNIPIEDGDIPCPISINDQWGICFRFQDGDAYDVEICDYH